METYLKVFIILSLYQMSLSVCVQDNVRRIFVREAIEENSFTFINESAPVLTAAPKEHKMQKKVLRLVTWGRGT